MLFYTILFVSVREHTCAAGGTKIDHREGKREKRSRFPAE